MLNNDVRLALAEGRFEDALNASVGATQGEDNLLNALGAMFGNSGQLLEGDAGLLARHVVESLLGKPDDMKAKIEHLRQQVPKPDRGLPNELAYQAGWHDALSLLSEDEDDQPYVRLDAMQVRVLDLMLEAYLPRVGQLSNPEHRQAFHDLKDVVSDAMRRFGMRSVTDGESAGQVDDLFDRKSGLIDSSACTACGVVVRDEYQSRHIDWHRRNDREDF